MRITRSLRCLGAVTLAGYVLAGFTPLPNLLAARLLEKFESVSADAVVVLGAGVSTDGELSVASLKRTVRGMELYQAGYAPLLVLLGVPAGPEDSRPEASVRRSLALAMQIPPDDILVASGAQTTREEARLVNEVLAPLGGRRILLVSDSLHLGRARLIFENQGFEVFAAPADTFSPQSTRPTARLGLMRWVLREQVARLYNRAVGY